METQTTTLFLEEVSVAAKTQHTCLTCKLDFIYHFKYRKVFLFSSQNSLVVSGIWNVQLEKKPLAIHDTEKYPHFTAEILAMYTSTKPFSTPQQNPEMNCSWTCELVCALGSKDGFYLQNSHKKLNKTFSQISLPLNITPTAQYRKKYGISQAAYVPNNWWIYKSKINQWNLNRSPQADSLLWTWVSICQEESFFQSVSEYYVNKKPHVTGTVFPLKNKCNLQETEGNKWAKSLNPDNLGIWITNGMSCNSIKIAGP